MLKRFIEVKKLILSILVAAASSAVFAQNYAGQFLNINSDARSLSLANTTAVMDASSFAIWNNVAASALSDDSFAASASYGMWQPSAADAQLISVAGFGKLSDKLTINAGAKYFMHQAYDVSNQEGIYNGTFTPSEYAAGLGLAYRFLPDLSVGMTLNYIGSDLGGPKSASAFAANLGLMYVKGSFRAGLTASNIGTKLNYGSNNSYSLPMRADVGAGYTLGSADASRFSISAQAGMLFADSSLTAAAAIEYKLKDIFRIGAGYNFCSAESAADFVSVGAGLSFFGVSVDVAYLLGVNQDALSNTLMLNLGYAF